MFDDLLGPYAEFQCDVWFSINSVRPGIPDGKRGKEADVVRWTALNADLDIKPGAFKNIAQAAGFIDRMSELIETRPTFITFSGHGLQPVWVIEDGELDIPEKYGPRPQAQPAVRPGRCQSRPRHPLTGGPPCPFDPRKE